MNRFQEALKSEDKFKSAGDDFFKSALELGKEIAEKGMRGEKVSAAEHEFMKNSAVFLIQGLISK